MRSATVLRSVLIACFYLAAASALSNTRIILGDTAAAASTTYPNRDPKYAVNGAGLTGDAHANTADYTVWMTQSSGAISGAWFRVDLGQVYPLHSFKLWNFNFWHATVATTNRGIQRAEVYISSQVANPGSDFSNPAVWTRAIDDVTFGKAPGLSSYTGEPPVSLSGLSARWLALRVLSNFGGAGADTVGISELQIFADTTPVIRSGAATLASDTQANLNGTLDYTGGADTHVYAFWGTADGGAVSSAWQNVAALGIRPLGPLSAEVPATPGAEHVFRLCAINEGGTSWSAPAAFIAAPVTVEMPATLAEGAGMLPVTFRRPAGLTNSALTVSFAFGGSAVPGLHYIAPPPSILIPAGAESAQLSLTLLDNVQTEENRTLSVGLAPGPYPVTAAGTNTTLLVDDDMPLDTTAWSRHMTVTFSGYTGSAILTNFPVALRLSEQIPGFRYADFSSPSDGADLRATDAATGKTLPHEIERWDPSGTSLVWVAVSTLAGQNTALTLHWRNANATMPGYTASGSTWEHGFSGVWHLKSTAAADSTANSNHGAPYGGVTAVSGVLGHGLSFTGNNYVEVPHHASLGADVASSLTVSTWFNAYVDLSRTNDVSRMLEKGDGYFFINGYGSQGGLVFLIKQNDTGVYSIGNGADISSNEWHHACATYNGATMRLYLDGQQVASASRTGLIDDDLLPLRIGSDDSGKFFKGILDETRIERTARGADWVKACYDSQKPAAAFAAFGEVRAAFPGTIILLQ